MSSLELQTAINAHSAWKDRFQLMISGLETRSIDEQLIGDASKCTLGKWLIDKELDYSIDPTFLHLKATHEKFHKVAVQIALLISAEKHTDAKALVEGTFDDLSRQIIEQLQMMRSMVKTTGP